MNTYIMFSIHFWPFVYVINLHYVRVPLRLISDIQRSGSWKKVNWSIPLSPGEPLSKRSLKYKCWIQYSIFTWKKIEAVFAVLWCFGSYIPQFSWRQYHVVKKSSEMRLKRLGSHPGLFANYSLFLNHNFQHVK